MKINYFRGYWLTPLIFLLSYQPTQAAEKIVLKYGLFQDAFSVPELSYLAQTGESSMSLNAYLKLANKNPEDLQTILTQNINVDGVILSKILNSFAGEIILDQMSEVIHTPSKTASRQSLRGALIQSAIDDNRLELIEVLENYPTQEIHVDGDRLVEFYNQIKGVIEQIPPISL